MTGLFIVAGLAGVLAALWIARPLLAAPARTSRLAGLAVAALVALGALGLYAVNGEPDAPGQPYEAMAERLRAADPMTLSPAEQEERLRDVLRRDPDDAEAAALLGRFLARTDRELEAIALFERALRVEESPRVLSDLGQALVVLNEGEVTSEARRAFSAAYALDPSLPEPAFFLGAAAYAEGDRAGAAQAWADILGRLEPGDPFRAAIAARAADLLSRPQGGPGADGAAPFAEAAAREGADMDALVAGMVAGLEARLEADPGDLSGWLTLARARMMLDEPEQARAALAAARAQFGANAGALAMIGAIERGLGAAEESET